MSNETSFRLYLQDLGKLLSEDAIEAKRDRDGATNKDRDFQSGRLLAYYEVITTMQLQAKVFGLTLEDISLDSLNPDRDLV